jgi:hypothetical protein
MAMDMQSKGKSPGQTTICVDFNDHGDWEIVVPDERDRQTCPTLDEAVRVAHLRAVDWRPCELVVRDAYHRVSRREHITR